MVGTMKIHASHRLLFCHVRVVRLYNSPLLPNRDKLCVSLFQTCFFVPCLPRQDSNHEWNPSSFVSNPFYLYSLRIKQAVFMQIFNWVGVHLSSPLVF